MDINERMLKEQLILQAASGDSAALEKAVSENMGLVRSVVRRFIGRGCDQDDLIQIGSIGLIKAIRNFNTEFNVCFSTYAVPMIAGEVKRFLRDDGPVKVSRSIKELYIKIKTVSDEFRNTYGREPSTTEIANKLDVDISDVIMALEAVQPVESIYSTPGDDSNSTGTCLLDRIANNEGVSVGQYEIMQDGTSEFEHLINNLTLAEVVNGLSDDEQKIIKLRYYKGLTQTEAAKFLNISQVQVSRLEKKILGKMKTMLLA